MKNESLPLRLGGVFRAARWSGALFQMFGTGLEGLDCGVMHEPRE